MAKGKLVKRFKRRKARQSSSSGGSPRHNPPMFTDLVEFIGPGFGGFAATRFTTRAVSTQVAKRWPTMGKHAGAVASIGSFLAAWLLAHRVKALAKYHTPIVVGAGIAALQSLMQIYIPKLGWVVSDASPDLAAAAQPQVTDATATGDDDGFDIIDESHWYTYNDAGDEGRYANAPPQRPAKAAQTTAPNRGRQAAAEDQSEDDAVFDLLDEEDGDMQAAGIFGGGN